MKSISQSSTAFTGPCMLSLRCAFSLVLTVIKRVNKIKKPMPGAAFTGCEQHNPTLCNTAAKNFRKTMACNIELTWERSSSNIFPLGHCHSPCSTSYCEVQSAYRIPTFATIQILKNNCQIIPLLDLSGRKEVRIRQNLNKTTCSTASMPTMWGLKITPWAHVVKIKASNVELVVMEKKTAEMDSKRTGGARVLPPEAFWVHLPQVSQFLPWS